MAQYWLLLRIIFVTFSEIYIMAQRFGKGTFNPPKDSYDTNTILVTSRKGNVYSGDIIASAKWFKGGFLLLANSLIKREDTIKGNPGVRVAKEDIRQSGLLIDHNEEYSRLKEDILLPSPTYAARLVHGYDVSGRVSWTNYEGLVAAFIRITIGF